MTNAFDIVVAGVITIMMFIIHRVSIGIFAPGNGLYEVATDGTDVMGGPEHATFLFEVIAIWMPILFIGGIWMWVAIRIYKRQVQTAARPA